MTSDAVGAAAQRYLNVDRDVIVFVGSIADFKKDLNKLGHVRIIPLNEVDFGSPKLVRGDRSAFPEN